MSDILNMLKPISEISGDMNSSIIRFDKGYFKNLSSIYNDNDSRIENLMSGLIKAGKDEIIKENLKYLNLDVRDSLSLNFNNESSRILYEGEVITKDILNKMDDWKLEELFYLIGEGCVGDARIDSIRKTIFIPLKRYKIASLPFVIDMFTRMNLDGFYDVDINSKSVIFNEICLSLFPYINSLGSPF